MTSLSQIRERHLQLMQKSCQTLGNILQNVSQETATTWRDGPAGWTVLEVTCHLKDFDHFFRQRAKMMLEQDYPRLPAYDHEALAIERAYNRQNLVRAYQELSESRREFGAFFSDLTESQWERAGVHPERGHFTMLDALMQVGSHDLTHLEQITRILLG
jgi:hypothetical protein